MIGRGIKEIMVFIATAGALICSVILFSYYAYRTAYYNSPKKNEDIYRLPHGEQYERERERMTALISKMDSIPYEEVWIESFDGVRLFGRYCHKNDGAPLQIQFHGYRGNAIRDFCGGNKLARDAGQNTLVVDQRAHGRSGGRTITFGIKERYDCLSWVKYACKRFGSDTEIYLSGVSMGAATVLMASELELPANVAGIIADCPYSSPEAIIRKVCRDKGYPPRLTMPFLRLGAFLFGHFDIKSCTAIGAVKNATVPILLIHGEDDRFVPCEISREIFEACGGNAVCETFPDAGHGLSFIVDAKRYADIIDRFVLMCRETHSLKS